MKRAQAISINTIVVAAIALVVLLLIVMIFTTNIGRWRESIGSCASVSGDCYTQDQLDNDDACSAKYQKESKHICYDDTTGEPDDRQCCITT